MYNRAKRATLIASGVAGVVVACLVLGIHAGNGVRGGRHAIGPLPFCPTAVNGSDSTFYAEMLKVHTRMHQDMEIVPAGNPDRDFARMMIPHHQGAIDMALVELKYGCDKRLRRLALGIIVEQGQEIAYMRSLLVTPSTETSDINHVTGK